MDLHEFQSKEILSRYGVAVPPGRVAWTAEEAESIARELDARRFAVKAQVHAGGRGRAGGVRLAATSDQVRSIAADLLGTTLVTEQTGPAGRTVRRVYVEAGVEAKRDLYVAVLVDRRLGAVTLIATRRGGEDIEERVARDPSIVERLEIPPDGIGGADYAGFAARLDLDGAAGEHAAVLFRNLVQAFFDLDASLIEINPLAVTAAGDVVALDVKLVLDDNALFRHPDLAELRDVDSLDPVELQAQRNEINFVRMDGDIGVVVNGAGLALATHDMLRDAGGRPANFMDIRTTANSIDIARGLDLLFGNPGVKVVLVNIHGGGMTRCDTVAEAIGISVRRSGRRLPIVYRAAGNNAEFSRTVLNNCGVAYMPADDMAHAVALAVAAARGEAA